MPPAGSDFGLSSIPRVSTSGSSTRASSLEPWRPGVSTGSLCGASAGVDVLEYDRKLAEGVRVEQVGVMLEAGVACDPIDRKTRLREEALADMDGLSIRARKTSKIKQVLRVLQVVSSLLPSIVQGPRQLLAEVPKRTLAGGSRDHTTCYDYLTKMIYVLCIVS